MLSPCAYRAWHVLPLTTFPGITTLFPPLALRGQSAVLDESTIQSKVRIVKKKLAELE